MITPFHTGVSDVFRCAERFRVMTFAQLTYGESLRISRDEDLLTSTTMPIQQIAFEPGFDSHYDFSSIFSKKTSVSPTEWRNLTI